MVGADSFEVLKTALIDLDPADIQADDKGMAYVNGGSNQHTVVAVVDMKKTRSIVARWRGIYIGACIRLSADQKRLYVASRGISPASIKSWLLPTRPDAQPTGGQLSDSPDAPLGGEIFLSPDDRFLLTRFGAVVPLGARPRTSAGPATTRVAPGRAAPSNSAVPKPRRLTPR